MLNRLFDIVLLRCEDDAEGTLLAAKENGQWHKYSAREVWETAAALSNGLLALGIDNEVLEPESLEKIAIISTNRPEWLITDAGVQMTGAALTPIYPTISPGELQFVLEDAGVKKVFVEGPEIYNRFKAALAATPTVTNVFSFDAVEGVQSWKELFSDNKTPDERVITRIKAETLATVIYTSGTTGSPKGVMLSHHNIVSNIQDSMPAFTFAERGAVALSFLPLNHIFERMVSYIYIQAGIGIYYAESMEAIGDNLREVKPMLFTTVPRLLEKVYERILGRGLELTGIKKSLFFWALNLAKRWDNIDRGSAWYRAQMSLADKLIFSKWREALGGNVKAIVSGSAPLQERLIRIFSAAKIVIMEGYGLTETSPVITVNRFESENRRIGTVGTLIDNVEVKIAEDGEILTKGPNVMMGYYKHPEQTNEAIHDGWFHTGDIGVWVENRFLKITDRKKEIFKTSGGKYVAPAPLENKMRESPYIEQIMVTGANEKFVGALIVPAMSQVKKWLKEHNIKVPEKPEEVVAMKEVHDLIRQQLDRYNPLFNHVEQIKKFELLPHEWTINGGELTPKLSMRRKAIAQKYAKAIEEIHH